MLVSSVGVPVYEHICSKQGTLISFYFKAKSCCSKKKANCNTGIICGNDTCKSPITEFTRKPCCKDKNHFSKDLTAGVKQIPLSVQKKMNDSEVIFPFFQSPFSENYAFSILLYYEHYKPPEIILKVFEMYQVIRC